MGLFASFLPATREEKFWLWFEKNSDALFDFESNQENIFGLLSRQLNKVNRSLTFEFGPVVDGKREFVISAGGIKSAFPAVERLYLKRPLIPQWVFIKYRPRRMRINSLHYGELSIKPEDIKFLFFDDENPGKIGVLLFLRGYDKKEKIPYKNIGYMFLDEVIGEYDVETYLGAIDFHGFDSEYFDRSIPINEMAGEYDAIKSRGFSQNSNTQE